MILVLASKIFYAEKIQPWITSYRQRGQLHTYFATDPLLFTTKLVNILHLDKAYIKAGLSGL